ncbi:hypothetical protein ACWZHB_10600 [Nocardia sp. FBN12]|uniref:hypothetical protein n=1 Tax=Nocardia sp. FBN12 TaxID=3419766 RepID=UPI003D0600CF
MANDSDRWWEAPGMSGPTPDPAQSPADPTLLRSPSNPPERPEDGAQQSADSTAVERPGSGGRHPVAPPTVFAQPGTGEQPSGQQPGNQPQWQQPGTGQPGSGQHPVAPPTVFGQTAMGQPPYAQQPGTGNQPQWQQPGTGQPGSGQHPVAPPPMVGQPWTGQQPYAQQGTGQQPFGQTGIGQDPYAPPAGSAQPYASQPGSGHQPYGEQFGTGQQPFAQPGYGQQPYGYAPAPQQYSPPPRRSGGSGAIIAVIAVVVVLVIGVAVAVAVSVASSDESATAASTTTTTKTGPLTGTSTAPLAPGSKGVLIPIYRVAYDVPSAWTIHADSDPMSFSTAAGTVNGRGQATEGADYCPGSVYRAMAAVTSTTETDLGAAAQSVAKISAGGGYSDPSGGTLSTPTSLKTQSGVSGQFVETSGAWTPTVPGCTANAYSVYTFGFRNAANTALVMTILVDRGTTGELTAEQAKKMINSLRLV